MSIKRNTLINLVGAIVPMAVMLVTIPLYLKQLGQARYGVLALVWLVLGYFSFLEMGLGKATANQIAKTDAQSIDDRSEIFWTALLTNAAMGVIAAGILWLTGGYLLSRVLTMPDDFRQEAVSSMPWMVATLPLALVSSVLNGALEGRARFLLVNLLQVASNALFQVIPLLAAYRWGSLLDVVIPAAVLSRAAMNIPFFMACHRVVPFTLRPHFSSARARSLLAYGGGVAVTSVVSPLMETLDRFLIGVVLGAKAVSHYTIAYQLATKIRILPASLSRALFPRFSSESSQASEVAVSSFSALLGIMTPAIMLAVLLVGPFLTLWVGSEVSEHAAPVARIILVGVWANSLAYIPLSLLQASGRPGLVARLHASEFIPFLIILYVATEHWGLLGAAVAWTARAVADSVLLYVASSLAQVVASKLAAPLAMICLALAMATSRLSIPALLICSVCLTMATAVWLTMSPVGAYLKQTLRQKARRVSNDSK